MSWTNWIFFSVFFLTSKQYLIILLCWVCLTWLCKYLFLKNFQSLIYQPMVIEACKSFSYACISVWVVEMKKKCCKKLLASTLYFSEIVLMIKKLVKLEIVVEMWSVFQFSICHQTNLPLFCKLSLIEIINMYSKISSTVFTLIGHQLRFIFLKVFLIIKKICSKHLYIFLNLSYKFT